MYKTLYFDMLTFELEKIISIINYPILAQGLDVINSIFLYESLFGFLFAISQAKLLYL